ncbi:hypothetical protein KKC60_00940, partial [Patescibacteria group bacterium]|nr:hypothetical protein [Patescibacteria group bacterium]
FLKYTALWWRGKASSVSGLSLATYAVTHGICGKPPSTATSSDESQRTDFSKPVKIGSDGNPDWAAADAMPAIHDCEIGDGAKRGKVDDGSNFFAY